MIESESIEAIIPRVLVTKIGLDGHDRGSRIVAAWLRDSGMEVIYTAPWQKIDTVVKIVQEEDVDVLAVSSLATDHLLIPKLMDALRGAGYQHVKVVVGGIVPDADEAMLLDSGVTRVFHPGSTKEEVVQWISEFAEEARTAPAVIAFD